MAPSHPRPPSRQVLLGVAVVGAFLALVATLTAVYVLGEQAIHGHLRSIGVPALASLRMPFSPAHLVIGAAVLVMIVALGLLLVHDGRHERRDA